MRQILITGSRAIEHRATVGRALAAVWEEFGREQLLVRHGNARGADTHAGVVARMNPHAFVEERHPVTSREWRPQGPNGPVDRTAGHRRNQRMVDLGADVCLAFLKHGERNAGTRDCIRRARAAGIEVREFWEEP